MFSLKPDDHEPLISLKEKITKSSTSKSLKTVLIILSCLCIALLWKFNHLSTSKHSVYSKSVVHSDGRGTSSSKQSVKATAEFSSDSFGVEGYVQINEAAEVTININIANLNSSLLTSICGADNEEYYYHIHNTWYYDDYVDRIGSDVCGAEYTEGHYNPFDAVTCSELADGEEITYFNCEVGDLSGRFGAASPDENGDIEINGEVSACKGVSRLSPESVYKKSIVFHCSSGTRFFCAPFIISYD